MLQLRRPPVTHHAVPAVPIRRLVLLVLLVLLLMLLMLVVVPVVGPHLLLLLLLVVLLWMVAELQTPSRSGDRSLVTSTSPSPASAILLLLLPRVMARMLRGWRAHAASAHTCIYYVKITSYKLCEQTHRVLSPCSAA